MDNEQLKKINYDLIDTFLIAGDRSIELRKIGLKKEIKSGRNKSNEIRSILKKLIRFIAI